MFKGGRYQTLILNTFTCGLARELLAGLRRACSPLRGLGLDRCVSNAIREHDRLVSCAFSETPLTMLLHGAAAFLLLLTLTAPSIPEMEDV